MYKVVKLGYDIINEESFDIVIWEGENPEDYKGLLGAYDNGDEVGTILMYDSQGNDVTEKYIM